MKFKISREWIESVSLEEDMMDPSAGQLSYDPAELAEPPRMSGKAPLRKPLSSTPITPAPATKK
jgi:hypothetical protein